MSLILHEAFYGKAPEKQVQHGIQPLFYRERGSWWQLGVVVVGEIDEVEI